MAWRCAQSDHNGGGADQLVDQHRVAEAGVGVRQRRPPLDVVQLDRRVGVRVHQHWVDCFREVESVLLNAFKKFRYIVTRLFAAKLSQRFCCQFTEVRLPAPCTSKLTHLGREYWCLVWLLDFWIKRCLLSWTIERLLTVTAGRGRPRGWEDVDFTTWLNKWVCYKKQCPIPAHLFLDI